MGENTTLFYCDCAEVGVFKCSVSPSTGGPHCRLFSISSSIASLFPFVVFPLALLGLRRLFENIKS